MIKNKFIRRFFLQHVTMNLVPVVIVLALLSFHTYQLLKETVSSNVNFEHEQRVNQIKNSMELLLREEDSLNLTMIASAFEFTQLREILSEQYPTPDMLKELARLKTFIDSPAIGKEYIESIYVYVENDHDRFITSSSGGIVDSTIYPDTLWLSQFKKYKEISHFWIEKRYTYTYGLMGEVDVVPVLSFFRVVPLKDNSLALIVLNIKEQYIKEEILQINEKPNQILAILNNQTQLLVANTFIDTVTANAILNSHEQQITINNMPYEKYESYSDKYNLNFLLFTTEDTSIVAYQNALFKVSLVALCIVLLFALAQTLKITRFFHSITKLLSNVKSPNTASVKKPENEDIYNYISENLIENFIQQDYLEMKVKSIKYEKQAAQLTMLQAQLNPHFLYNTLESINWRTTALVGHYNPVNEMIEHLSDILRYALEEPGNIVPFEIEEAYSNHYLAIQQIRFDHSFSVIWEVDEEVYNRKILKLFFQPILENILFHAFHNGELEGKIKIKIKCTESETKIYIIDNGAGMTKEQLTTLRYRLQVEEITSKHIGILNTHMRLKIVYDNAFTFKILSKKNWGTVFEVTIPANNK